MFAVMEMMAQTESKERQREGRMKVAVTHTEQCVIGQRLRVLLIYEN